MSVTVELALMKANSMLNLKGLLDVFDVNGSRAE